MTLVVGRWKGLERVERSSGLVHCYSEGRRVQFCPDNDEGKNHASNTTATKPTGEAQLARVLTPQ